MTSHGLEQDYYGYTDTSGPLGRDYWGIMNYPNDLILKNMSLWTKPALESYLCGQ